MCFCIWVFILRKSKNQPSDRKPGLVCPQLSGQMIVVVVVVVVLLPHERKTVKLHCDPSYQTTVQKKLTTSKGRASKLESYRRWRRRASQKNDNSAQNVCRITHSQQQQHCVYMLRRQKGSTRQMPPPKTQQVHKRKIIF